MVKANEVEAELRQSSRLKSHVLPRTHSKQRLRRQVGSPEATGHSVFKYEIAAHVLEEAVPAGGLLFGIQE